ncbi:MAG TPA: DUF2207 domain-containing protein, partial [Thermoanaerobaculia bacterium]
MGANSMRLGLCAFLIASSLSAKSLYWRSFDVTARLDASGRLHVREVQDMVFDGDWNGGERTFNIRPGQSLDFQRMFRVENGRDIPMTEGDTTKVDHWYLNANNVLRWRSRLPSDPPFQNQEITYALEYELSGVLQRTDDGVRLDNDFAFPARSGNIENFSLRLDLDPLWRGLRSPLVIQRHNIPPGQGVVVTSDLTYVGSGSPADVRSAVTRSHALTISILLLIAGAILAWKFYVDEKHKGRFAPLLSSGEINRAWLQRYVFSIPPEAVGYAWDEVAGAPEVGAVIARMEQEKKVKTWVDDRKVLHMKLLGDWTALPPGEKELVEGLFLGQLETDTDRVKQYYKSTGFQPQKLLQPSIDAALQQIPEWKSQPGWFSGAEAITLIAMVFVAWIAFNSAKPLGFILVLGVLAFVIGIIAGLTARRRVDVGPWAAIVAAFALIAVGITGAFVAIGYALSDFAAGSVAVTAGIAAAFILMISRSRETIAKIEFRRRLAAARKYFENELSSAHPNLDDAWYPYLVALGLGPSVDRWFTSFAAAASTIHTTSFGSSSSSSFGSSPSTSSWTGG